MRKLLFFPGKMSVAFRKGPLGYLRQDPTDAAKLLKDNPSLQDRSAPLKEELVRKNALTVVRQRGGDASDKTEVFGEYILQFGKYKGKSFRWLLENDIGYTIYLLKSHKKEEAAGVFVAEGHSKDSLLSFVSYALSFKEIESLRHYDSEKYLQKKQHPASDPPLTTQTPRAPAEATVMDEDEELERAMLSISPSKQPQSSVSAAPRSSTARQRQISRPERGS